MSVAVTAFPGSKSTGAVGQTATFSAPVTGPSRAGTGSGRPGAGAGGAVAKPYPALAPKPGPVAAPPPAGDPFDLVLLSPELAVSVPQEELAGARVVVLEAGLDGIGQIGAALAAHPGASVVRVISHGEPGTVLVAGQAITKDTLVERAEALAGWRQHLAAGAEILLYGCSVAASPEGRALVDGLAALTGAAVAASVTPTGSAAQGGDLTLGYTTGPIAAQTERFSQAWDHSALILAAPEFTSPASADFTRAVAGSFAVAATGSPTYSIAPATLFESSFITLPSDWALSSAQISGGSAALNPATASTNGALFLPKLGASSPGSFTAAFDYTAGNVTVGGTTASGTSFNYGALSTTTARATGMVGSNGLVVSFLEAYTKTGAVTTTAPSSVEVRWNGTVIAAAPVSFGSGAKPVQIKLDAANLLSVSYDGAQVLNANLSGKVNAADRSNWQFALGSANTSANTSSHSIDNLAIVTNGGLPAGSFTQSNHRRDLRYTHCGESSRPARLQRGGHQCRWRYLATIQAEPGLWRARFQQLLDPGIATWSGQRDCHRGSRQRRPDYLQRGAPDLDQHHAGQCQQPARGCLHQWQ